MMAIGIDTTSTAPTIPPFPVRAFSVQEYLRLGEVGVLTEDEAVELLEGWIVPKMNRGPTHDAIVALIDHAIRPLLSEGWHSRGQSAIATANSVPEPDLAILRGSPRDYLKCHPSTGDIACVIEVAESSLSRDRQKARIYAQAGIPSYWIVNLVDNCIEVHGQPDLSAGKYQQFKRHDTSSSVTLFIEGVAVGKLAVVELLPR